MSHAYAADPRSVRQRPRDPALEAKVDRILALAKKREGLRKVQEAARRIQAELEHRLEQARRAGGADEGWFLREVRLLRCDLDELEI